MTLLYRIVLLACLALTVGLAIWRLANLFRQHRQGQDPSLGRLLNEWTWTLVPIAVLVALLWRAV